MTTSMVSGSVYMYTPSRADTRKRKSGPGCSWIINPRRDRLAFSIFHHRFVPFIFPEDSRIQRIRFSGIVPRDTDLRLVERRENLIARPNFMEIRRRLRSSVSPRARGRRLLQRYHRLLSSAYSSVFINFCSSLASRIEITL